MPNTNYDPPCGYLAPSGELTECEPWEHMDTARELAEKLNADPAVYNNGFNSEDFIFDLGYVAIRARDVYGKIGHITKSGSVIHLTEEQKKWLTDNYERCLPVTRKHIDDLMDNLDKTEL